MGVLWYIPAGGLLETMENVAHLHTFQPEVLSLSDPTLILRDPVFTYEYSEEDWAIVYVSGGW